MKKEASVNNDRGIIPGLEQIELRRQQVREAYGKIADIREKWIIKNRYFYTKLGSFLKFIIEPGRSVALFRSELGQLLDSISPSRATGVDLCAKTVSLASDMRPQYSFINADPESVELPAKYDYLIFYSLGDIIDIEKAFINASKYAEKDSRLIVINYSFLWYPLILLAEKIGWKIPQPAQNWLNVGTIENLLHLADFEVIKKYQQILLPLNIPLISWFFNDIIAKIPVIKKLCFIQVLVAKRTAGRTHSQDKKVTVIIPCKNEAGNIESAAKRIPEMGNGTEIIFCDDLSTDGTVDEVKRTISKYPEKNIRLVSGPGICKAKNVWEGFDAATGDILMILDADLTVIPEELQSFYRALADGRGEFINGSRMIYPMQDQAMRGLNIIGNKFFSLCFSYILGQEITDTLCGTKVLWRKDWRRIKPFMGSWGVEDRWGDYELLFGAAKLHLKIIEVPVHYMERVYGETKMHKRLANGLNMLKMCIAAFRKFKFI